MTLSRKHLPQEKEDIWSKQNAAWRDPAQITAQWMGADSISDEMLSYRVTGHWWDILDATGSTLLVTREYEHLVLAMTVFQDRPLISYLPLPHPSGLAVDVARNILHIASTRNPNMVFDFSPAAAPMQRLDIHQKKVGEGSHSRLLIPRRARYYPGCFYIHDLAFIGNELHANSVGQNAVVRLGEDGNYERVWWPRCIEKQGKPVFEINHLQLNSIAAGNTLSTSFFSASTDKLSSRRPGHKNFPVDRRGVLFSGATREPIAFGLTRPHSARLYNEKIFVDNSGYGELSAVEDGKVTTAARLPGWIRNSWRWRLVARPTTCPSRNWPTGSSRVGATSYWSMCASPLSSPPITFLERAMCRWPS